MKLKRVNVLCFFQMLNSIRDCFVTGTWEEGQDAATLLKEDGEFRVNQTPHSDSDGLHWLSVKNSRCLQV